MLKLQDKTYDFLKWVAIYFIPSLTTFVGVVGLAVQWEQTAVATTIIGAFGAFLAGCIGMSVKAYEKAKKEEYEGVADSEEEQDIQNG